jgi:hypothetical protein
VEHLRKAPPYTLVTDGNIVNCTTRVMKRTCGKLLQQEDWSDWQELKYLQLDQYNTQGMFGAPVAMTNVKVNAYDKPFNYLLASPFWSPKTMWMEVPVKIQKTELSCIQIRIKLCSSTEIPTMSR